MWLAAISLGLAGSLHCVGMCSPLVVAVTARRKGFGNRVLYNGGRILTYAILGSIIGLLGAALDFTGFQKLLSLSLGVLLIILGAVGIGSLNVPFLHRWLGSLSLFVKQKFAGFLSGKNKGTLLMMGMINGLLPCGLTYVALAYCVTLDPLSGFAYMALFGLSTLPVMLGFTSFLPQIISRFKVSSRQLTMVALISLGVLLVYRSYTIHGTYVPGQQAEITICR